MRSATRASTFILISLSRFTYDIAKLTQLVLHFEFQLSSSPPQILKSHVSQAVMCTGFGLIDLTMLFCDERLCVEATMPQEGAARDGGVA
jgi:hypothetical protein